ncbi:MAG: tetratricopeptide repeat protein [Pirellulales bacterium]|nr:tetratricopeptide repeat protein [Pirellulales bacterium]
MQRAARDAARHAHGRFTLLAVAGALALVTALTFGRMVWDRHDFVLYDDPHYVTHNPLVSEGWSWHNVAKAFSPAYPVVGNYHPITVLSHMLDAELYGVDEAWGHHLTNLVFHIINAMLLLVVLERMTGNLWPSALAAALFAWHPLHVESVAWVAERKDVLSTFFWFLAIGFYTFYARGSRWWYLGVLICAMLGLLSKPMVVTLPFTLLLLDYWPLDRITFLAPYDSAWRRSLGRLILEKVPLLAASLASIALTLNAQALSGAVVTTSRLPLYARVMNAVHSYNQYLTKTVWPTGLVNPYEFSGRALTPISLVLGSVGIGVVTYLVIRWGRRFPYLPVGWFWYLGTLVPVIGLVQVGIQAMADRYTYVPLVGLSIIAAWGLRDFLAGSESRTQTRLWLGLVGAWLVALAALTCVQVGHWRNTITLFRHTWRVEPNNFTAAYALATGYFSDGDLPHALEAVSAALRLDPNHGMAWQCKGRVLLAQHRWADAIEPLSRSLQLGYAPHETLTDIGIAQSRLGQATDARQNLQAALKHNPEEFRALVWLGVLAKDAGDVPGAIDFFQRAHALRPTEPSVNIMLARIDLADADSDRAQAARNKIEAAIGRTKEPRPYWFDTLAMAQAATGDSTAAIASAERALALAQKEKELDTASAIQAHLAAFRRSEQVREELTAIPALAIFDLFDDWLDTTRK